VHEGVDVEGGVEGVGEAVEEVNLKRLDADVVGGDGSGDVILDGGAIVAFEDVTGLGYVSTGGGGSSGFSGCRHADSR
jgi:hypothetical protein